ncbi:MAG: deoxyribose-phosphate aldolase [Armatimonadota bacterium]|nr:deoxyribose-phosphate aldolase [Armatimonadota bacterium]MDR7450539.1 deoxyribose-phosphate aldolase [Armatimonadota bacterium]MDR7466328.1 deoxyribose-phosphate aldolase [Armatimonadota bacterium]MDR7493049.1 deoxyribose-phosphate aldolase [Armatimonadota bacterium]MDR7498194.1 deoxyribose-phosphate aldolase [Armatimonadota bacterium]
MDASELAARLEHAVLAPQATRQDLEAGVQVATRWKVRALVVKPCHVAEAARQLFGTGIKTVAVVGFPHGGSTTATKVAETRQAVAHGADEIDVVIDIGALRGRQTGTVFFDLRSVVEAAEGRPVKAIIETAYLTDAEKRLACRLAARAGAAYVKTSTGFAPRGATAADVALLRRILPRGMKIKAAGGIKTYADALALLQAGADVIGTSHTEAILRDAGVAVAA